MLILAFAVCAALGYLVVVSAWPYQKLTWSGRMISVSLVPAIGLGVFSVVFWLVRLLGGTHFILVDATLLVVLGLTYLLRRSRAAHESKYSSSSRAEMNCPPYSRNSLQSRDLAFASHSLDQNFVKVSTKVSEGSDINAPKWLAHTLTASFTIAFFAALYHAAVRVITHPHGEGWDAFAIWNLHARFLFLGATHWRDGFNSLIPWSHPDYPLLLPATIAHLWSYLGHDHPLVPAIVSLIFAFSTLALLVSSLASLRGRNAAMLGGLALSSTPFFVEQGTSQYADVPLSFFILASIVLLHVSESHCRESARLMGLSGLAAGFAAWTKNEGLLFLVALIVAQVAATSTAKKEDSACESRREWRLIAYFGFGTVPLLLLVAWFKHTIGTPGDLLSSPSTMLQRILTPTRYWIILEWFGKELLRFGNWWIVPGTAAMLAFYLSIFRSQKSDGRPASHISALALLLTLAGYFAVYLITPRDLYWHLRFSLNRLFLQVWPSAIFLFFLFLRPSGMARSRSESDIV